MSIKQDWFLYEKQAFADGYCTVCGVDEAGRGPLAGPIYAAAVILPQNFMIDGLNDSKKLSARKREFLYDKIIENALAFGIAFASETEIDQINILNATFLAMKRAVDALKMKPDLALIDGSSSPKLDSLTKTIIKGDSLSASIAAASILAKVTRDRFMTNLSYEYPQYGFEKHKGYGTKIHVEAIKKYGPSTIHRKSFLKKILGTEI